MLTFSCSILVIETAQFLNFISVTCNAENIRFPYDNDSNRLKSFSELPAKISKEQLFILHSWKLLYLYLEIFIFRSEMETISSSL